MAGVQMDSRLTVGERLTDLGVIFESRKPLYGDSYKHMGKVLKSLFPNGLILDSEFSFNRLVTFIQLLMKVNRYAFTIRKGEWQPDSLDDLAIYTQILRAIEASKLAGDPSNSTVGKERMR